MDLFLSVKDYPLMSAEFTDVVFTLMNDKEEYEYKDDNICIKIHEPKSYTDDYLVTITNYNLITTFTVCKKYPKTARHVSFYCDKDTITSIVDMNKVSMVVLEVIRHNSCIDYCHDKLTFNMFLPKLTKSAKF